MIFEIVCKIFYSIFKKEEEIYLVKTFKKRNISNSFEHFFEYL